MISYSSGEYQISPTIDSVWVKLFPIGCCEEINAFWFCPTPCWSFSACSTQVRQLILWTADTRIDTGRVYFTINDGIDPVFQISESTHPDNIDFICITANCDSVFVEINNFLWTDNSTVTISLDSAFTNDGCISLW